MTSPVQPQVSLLPPPQTNAFPLLSQTPATNSFYGYVTDLGRGRFQVSAHRQDNGALESSIAAGPGTVGGVRAIRIETLASQGLKDADDTVLRTLFRVAAEGGSGFLVANAGPKTAALLKKYGFEKRSGTLDGPGGPQFNMIRRISPDDLVRYVPKDVQFERK